MLPQVIKLHLLVRRRRVYFGQRAGCGAPKGHDRKGHFSVSQFSVTNLEVCVHLSKSRMYPTQSAVNLQNVSRILVQDSQFCLDDTIGDAVQQKRLHGSMKFHQPFSDAGFDFPIVRGEQFKVTRF